MKALYNRFISFLNTIKSNIAFYPTIMSLFGFFFAMLMLYLENKGISAFIIKHVPALVINNADTARTLLSFLTGGIISVMVFSFSMVMVLLNQASSNFSPRVLPDLISNRRHQYILGTYLATIIYNTFTSVGIDPKPTDDYQLPGFSVLLGIVFTVLCFGAFLYFIHSISQSIQINNILDSIYKKSSNRLHLLLEAENDTIAEFPDTSTWKTYYSKKTGYFQKMALTNLVDICLEHQIKLEIIPMQGMFVLEGIPIFKVSKEIDEKIIDDILINFNYARGEFVEDNYVLGFKQITEIGVRAMSPGINDPGTAINTIDYLTQLFALRLRKKDETIITAKTGEEGDEKEEVCIFINTTNFKELLYQVIASYRTYCKGDPTCVQKLLVMFKNLLLQKPKNKAYKKALLTECDSLYQDAKQAISNENDLAIISAIYNSFNTSNTTKNS